MSDYKIILLDDTWTPLGIMTEYTDFNCRPTFNEPGTWTLSITDQMHNFNLVTDTGGILLRRGDQDIFSGRIDYYTETWEGGVTKVIVSGHGDLMLLQERIVIPEPATTSPPYNTDEHYVVGPAVAGTVLHTFVDNQAGPSARTGRAISGLTLGTDLGLGLSLTASARWLDLLSVLRAIALEGGDLGFQFLNGEFSVYESTDRSDEIVFSRTLGNIQSYKYQTSRPKANYVFVGDKAEGTLKTIVEVSTASEVIKYGAIEKFLGANPDDNSELTGIGNTYLASKGELVSLTFIPSEEQGILFQTDYFLGDTIGLNIGDNDLDYIIRQVVIAAGADGIFTQKMVIGTPSASTNPLVGALMINNLREVETRLSRIEGA